MHARLHHGRSTSPQTSDSRNRCATRLHRSLRREVLRQPRALRWSQPGVTRRRLPGTRSYRRSQSHERNSCSYCRADWLEKLSIHIHPASLFASKPGAFMQKITGAVNGPVMGDELDLTGYIFSSTKPCVTNPQTTPFNP